MAKKVVEEKMDVEDQKEDEAEKGILEEDEDDDAVTAGCPFSVALFFFEFGKVG